LYQKGIFQKEYQWGWGVVIHIEPIFCGIPTLADDVTLISNDPHELLTMLDIQSHHSNKLRYQINEQKSVILVFNDNDSNTWYLTGKPMSLVSNSTHLGIKRDKQSDTGTKMVVKKRMVTARRTVYSLIGAGLHGLNGVNSYIAIHMIQIYVIPRLLYGLDVIKFMNEDIKNVSLYQRKLLKQIQNLPERTSNAAALLLLGQIDIESEIHKRILKLFGSIIRNEHSVERKLALRQLAMQNHQSGSWFVKVVELAELYGLPSAYDLLDTPPGKYQWKQLVNKAVYSYHSNILKEEAQTKSSLKYIYFNNSKDGKVHNISKSCGSEPYAVSLAAMKAKIATGTIILQKQVSRFSNNTKTPICQLCSKEIEDILHFIVRCSALQKVQCTFSIPDSNPGCYL
jgi:hypothetical protein